MKITKTIANENGSRPPIQSWSEDSPPDGFAVCPESFATVFTAAKGFVNIAIESGIVVDMTENTAAKKAWEAANPPKPPQPSPDEDRDAMLADLAYRTALIELGVN